MVKVILRSTAAAPGRLWEVRCLNSVTIATANNVNNGTISVNSLGNQTDVIIDGTQTLDGSGEIVMGATNTSNRVVIRSPSPKAC